MQTKPSKIVITAGPTREPLDPVRYISNFSTGAMGYALAAEAEAEGFDVCLITGPVALSAPLGVRKIDVTTAEEMLKAVEQEIEGSCCVIMAAAVCDFRPVKASVQKIRKTGGRLRVELEENPDIIASIGRREGLLKIGFALETRKAVRSALEKLQRKQLDLIVVNEISGANDPFGEGKKDFLIMGCSGERDEYKALTKRELAAEIVRRVRKKKGDDG
ncbi:MAG: hypothetical protein GF408_00995 [Candidatus Omnitrophica bacterium]|nr:hypothetical protein [Candidatus Omnitrophota bacterium]